MSNAAVLSLLSLAACTAGEALPTEKGTKPTDPSVPTGTTPTVPTVPVVVPELTLLGDRLHDQFGTLVIVSWDQSEAADVVVEFEVDAGVWMQSPVRTLAAGVHEEYLLGVPYNHAVSYRVVATNTAGTAMSEDGEAQTASLPVTMPQLEVTVADPDRYDPEMRYIFTSITEVGGSFGDPWWALMLDRQARVVWAQRSPVGRMSMHVHPSYDGTALLVDQNSYWAQFDGGAGGSVRKMLLDGTTLQTWETPGLHHPHTELADGSLAYGRVLWPSINEYLDVVHPDGSVDRLFDCEAWLAEQGFNDYCGSNTLNYDTQRDTYLFSFFSFETVIEIDATSGDVLRWFGEVPGGYAFDPPNSQFYYQHGGYWTDAGTLLFSGHNTANNANELVAREYTVDPVAETLTEVWSFGLGEGVYGSDMGEAFRLSNGNTLHNYGTLTRFREVTTEGDVVWDASVSSHDLGRSTPVSDMYVFLPERP